MSWREEALRHIPLGTGQPEHGVARRQRWYVLTGSFVSKGERPEAKVYTEEKVVNWWRMNSYHRAISIGDALNHLLFTHYIRTYIIIMYSVCIAERSPHIHAHTHARMHTRMHARMHAHTCALCVAKSVISDKLTYCIFVAQTV